MPDTKITPCIECGTPVELDPIYNDGILVGYNACHFCAECGDPLCESCVDTGLPMYRYGDGNEQEVCTKCHEALANPSPTTNVGHTSLLTLMKDGIQCLTPKKN